MIVGIALAIQNANTKCENKILLFNLDIILKENTENYKKKLLSINFLSHYIRFTIAANGFRVVLNRVIKITTRSTYPTTIYL